ncbi:MAG: HAD hydrolase-like protein, partial [Succinatimonas sp.]|nr:HAD hydrolase-like protein [Succinatimonas sp.]
MTVSKEPNVHKLGEVLDSVRAMAFDLDGTLCDSIGNIIACTNFTFDAHKYRRPEKNAIVKTIGLRLEEGLRELLPDEHKSEY